MGRFLTEGVLRRHTAGTARSLHATRFIQCCWLTVAVPLCDVVANHHPRDQVVVFFLFGAPAAVMSASFYVDDSEDPYQTINCQHVCELVLAFRTLATVRVYFSAKECRDQLADWRSLRSKMWGRMQHQLCCGQVGGSSGDVRFQKLPEPEPASTFEMEPLSDGEGVTPGQRPVSTADSDVMMMGSKSFQTLLGLDQDKANRETRAAGNQAALGDGVDYVLLTDETN